MLLLWAIHFSVPRRGERFSEGSPPDRALKGVVKIVKRHLAAGLLVALLISGSPAAPPPPVQAESVPVVVYIPPYIVLITEGDPDTPDGTCQGPNYVAYGEGGSQIEVDHNWLTEFLFNALGNWFDLTD